MSNKPNLFFVFTFAFCVCSALLSSSQPVFGRRLLSFGTESEPQSLALQQPVVTYIGTNTSSGVCLRSHAHKVFSEEGLPVLLTLGCDTPLTPPFVISSPLPAGALLINTALKAPGAPSYFMQWTPTLTQAGYHRLTLYFLAQNNASVTVDFHIADAFDAANNTGIDDSKVEQYQSEYGVPVLHVTTAPDTSPETDDYVPAATVYGGVVYKGTAVKARGASSRRFPQHSYSLKFSTTQLFNEAGGHHSSGGLRNLQHLAIITTFDDPTFVRHRIGYELWRNMSAAHIAVTPPSYAVLYLNGEYMGLYVVSQLVDKDFLEARGLNPDGNLYMGMDWDANYNVTGKEFLSQGFEKKEGRGAWNEMADLDALTVFVSNSSDTEFRERLKDWVDVEDVKNWWAFVLFLSATDNRAKNMYVYSDADAEKPFFRFITWDLNAIMGFDWWTDKVAIWEPPLFDLHFIDCNHIWERMYADPALKAELADHMTMHLKGVFSDSLEAAIRAVYNEIEFAGARSHRRWGTAYREFEDWTYRTEFLEPEEEVQFMLEWVQGRRALVKWQLESEHAGLAMG